MSGGGRRAASSRVPVDPQVGEGISKNNSSRPERQVRLMHLTPKTSIANHEATGWSSGSQDAPDAAANLRIHRAHTKFSGSTGCTPNSEDAPGAYLILRTSPAHT